MAERNLGPIEPSVVREALLSYAEKEFDYASFGEWDNYSIPKGTEFEVENLGSVILVDYHGYDQHKNYDGWSEDLWVVFDVDGILYRAKGTYTSWTGSEWDDEMTIVTARPKTVIEYEDVE